MPQKLAIVTVGASIWVHYVNPPLSSVHGPIDTVGKEAAEILFEQLQHELVPPRQITLPTSLILRSSTATH